MEPSSTSVRVLIRPPSSLAPTSSSSSQTVFPQSVSSLDPLPPPPSSVSSPSLPRPPEGVVVVGFIGRNPDDTAQLINRIVDFNAFGSGKLDKDLRIEKEEVREWFNWRRVSYYHEEEKGILFLQFCSTRCPAMEDFTDDGSSFVSAVEEQEFRDLQGMLFMFSVCHVIVYVQEGMHFRTPILQKFRLLQSAKHSLTPFVRSRTNQPLPSRPHSSSSLQPTSSASASKNSSPGRSGSMLTRNASAVSLMSGFGSYTSLFPGQCTPVILFLFIDDFVDAQLGSSNVDESMDIPPINQPSTSGSSARPQLPVKGSGSVVVLARPVSKAEGSFRKKLQSSLEAQIRFLIKKSRTLTGSEASHAGSRGGGASSSAPLFSLDASRAVVLLDRSANRKAESLEFATNLVEDVLSGKATSDSLLLESHGQSTSNEDITSVKEFIYRQSDILRGRGGLVPNASSSSAAGVGMVAVAAAAAAASAASGKTHTTPELPTMEMWLSSSQSILQGLLSAKGGCLEELETSRRKPRSRHSVPASVEASKGVDPMDVAITWLESGKDLNTKFSTSWCEKSLPAAREVYLKDLPACYPTSLHEAHLEKALGAFRLMVKGPAVEHFAKKLEEECTSIWTCERQLCDAVSLTGKPCIHERHGVENREMLLGATAKSHSSGYVFLHACACGRSRRLRPDPFDFESANISFNYFSDCDTLLPALQLPQERESGPIELSSWSLIRIGGAKYYDPSKGLLQSGFCASQKFLLQWKIITGKRKFPSGSTSSSVQHGSLFRSIVDTRVDVDADVKSSASTKLSSGNLQTGVESQRKSSEEIRSDDRKNSTVRGPLNFTMKKAFSEVVAGSAAPGFGFPPIQQKKQPPSDSNKSATQSKTVSKSLERVHLRVDHQEPQKSGVASSLRGFSNGISASESHGVDSFLQIGSNVVPVNLNGSGKAKSSSLKHVSAYIGFEHECPHGHRFLLNSEHLDELGSSFPLLNEQKIASGLPGKAHQNPDAKTIISVTEERNIETLRDTVPSGRGLEKTLAPVRLSTGLTSVIGLEGNVKSATIDDGGSAFSMLNRNLPIYMNCPHCKNSENKKNPPNVKFAGKISQLQRIFVVTPPPPVVLAMHPVIQFEDAFLPPSVPDRQQKLQFSFRSEVILPPDSFLVLRLPFVYGVQLDDGNLHSLKPFEHQPEATAWISSGTTLQVLSKHGNLDGGL